MNARCPQKGFLIVEVLVVVLVLAAAFTFFMTAMRQALRVSERSGRTPEAISKLESLFFQLESGLRPDLAGYGGQADAGDGYQCRLEVVKNEDYAALLKSRLSWKSGREFIEQESWVSKAPVQ